MFAKVFSQIFDSSIAEDYNCRRMFIDLLILSDSSGVVDMTPEAISRRTNVPIEQVNKYLTELNQPDPLSRSGIEEGRRIVLIDSHRNWGWRIVNYEHYRAIRDEEARRAYFRDKQREHRKTKKKKKNVFDNSLTTIDGEKSVPSASSSSSKSSCTQKEAEEFCVSIGLPASDGTAMFLHWEEKGWARVKDWRLTIRKWRSFGYLPSQKQRNTKSDPEMTHQQRQARINTLNERKAAMLKRFPDPQNLPSVAAKDLAKIEAELKTL